MSNDCFCFIDIFKRIYNFINDPKHLIYFSKTTNYTSLITYSLFLIYMVTVLFIPNSGICQNKDVIRDQYILNETDKFTIVVHIWGEVRRPGEFIVPDDTNIIELISLAGGPTEFSNLSNVHLTRAEIKSDISQSNSNDAMRFNSFSENESIIIETQLLIFNIKKYLKGNTYNNNQLTLQPGDVVRVQKNRWHKWSTFIRVVGQFALIAQAVYFYSRIEK